MERQSQQAAIAPTPRNSRRDRASERVDSRGLVAIEVDILDDIVASVDPRRQAPMGNALLLPGITLIEDRDKFVGKDVQMK